MEKQTKKRPILLADMEKICGDYIDTPIGVSKDICNKCLLGKWHIEELYALIGHMRFCEGLLRLEPLIAEKSKMKGSEKSRQSLLDENSVREFQFETFVDVHNNIFVEVSKLCYRKVAKRKRGLQSPASPDCESVSAVFKGLRCI